MIYLAVLTAFNLGTSAQETLYFSDVGYTSQRTDTPADKTFSGRISDAANVAVSAFSDATTYGGSSVSGGVVELVNVDGGLDYLAGYAFAGWPITVYAGPNTQASFPAGFSVVFAGVMEMAEFDLEKVSLRVRDASKLLDKPVGLTKYLGNNALPAGLEGVSGDLKDKLKPWGVGGQVQNFAPPQVNTSLWIYQVSDSPIASLDAVYDSNVALTAGAAYTSIADMLATAPAASTYRLYSGAEGAYFRLGTKPGTPTCDATFAASGSRSAGQAWKQILLRAGISAGNIAAADITALDAACPGDIALWVAAGDTTTLRALADQAAASACAAWWQDAAGTWHIARLDAPSGTPVATISPRAIVDIKRLATNDPDKGVPWWRVTVLYGRNFTPVSGTIQTNTTEARKAWLASEYRNAVAEDASVKTAWPGAIDMTTIEGQNGYQSITTALVNQSDAATLATSVLALRKVPRQLWEVTIDLTFDATYSAAQAINAVVSLSYSRFGLAGGKLMRVIGYQPDAARQRATLTLWC